MTRIRHSNLTMKFFEDIEVGAKHSFGNYEVTREEVIQFATMYDPQAFHLDDEAAAKTYFGKVSASGWHTCSMTMRMLVDDMAGKNVASLGSPGVDEVRWLRPVYPGDTLRAESEFVDKRQSNSKPEMGSYRSKITVVNQDDQPVLTMVSIALIRVRGS
jgi:acyl dehydratase